MSRSTGPILVAGGLSWANQTILAPEKEVGEDFWKPTLRIGVATGLAAGALHGIEKLSPELAVGIAYITLVTVLFVRMNNKPTPLERGLNLIK
jgi:hypothetical protein